MTSESWRIMSNGIEFRVEYQRTYRLWWWSWSRWRILSCDSEAGPIRAHFWTIEAAREAARKAIARKEADRRGFQFVEMVV